MSRGYVITENYPGFSPEDTREINQQTVQEYQRNEGRERAATQTTSPQENPTKAVED